jgi:hypothetical protein
MAVGAAALAPLAAAAGFALLGGSGESPPATSSQTFAAKGPSQSLLSARCPGRPAGECRIGDRLVFEVEGAKAPAFFAAYADCAARERIWYFPTANGELPAIPGGQARAVVPTAAHIGSEHGTGVCHLHLFALAQRESRDTLVGGGEQHTARADLLLNIAP